MGAQRVSGHRIALKPTVASLEHQRPVPPLPGGLHMPPIAATDHTEASGHSPVAARTALDDVREVFTSLLNVRSALPLLGISIGFVLGFAIVALVWVCRPSVADSEVADPGQKQEHTAPLRPAPLVVAEAKSTFSESKSPVAGVPVPNRAQEFRDVAAPRTQRAPAPSAVEKTRRHASAPRIVAGKSAGKQAPVVRKIDNRARDVAEGKKLFQHVWTPGDRLAGHGDGLGPVFNAQSCAECHFQGALGGSGPNEHNVQSFEIVPSAAGQPVQAGVVHALAVQSDLLESSRHAKFVLGNPQVPIRSISTGKQFTTDAFRVAWLNTPALWGDGLIDRISPRDLAAAPGGNGRLRTLPDGRVGKFGWKSQFASLHDFVAAACAVELGLSNSQRAQQVPTEFRDAQRPKPDMTDGQVRSLTEFVASLPAPQQVLPTDQTARAEVYRGRSLFNNLGCVQCHTQDVGPAQGVFSDFRLHRVIDSTLQIPGNCIRQDAELVIALPREYPQLQEWKTPPLWGLADTAPYWHDGSAPNLNAAILKHGQDAEQVKEKYRRLPAEDQEAVIAFLKTLRAPQIAGPF